MSKTKTAFICQNCGASYPKWQGQCVQCKEWNSLVEEAVKPVSQSEFGIKSGSGQHDQQATKQLIEQFVTSLPEVKTASASKQRFSSGIGELDRVLGGGIVPGAVILLGGEPGVGKSTLLTQMSLSILSLLSSEKTRSFGSDKKNKSKEKNKNRAAILYICGEESPEQINLRINRSLNNEQLLSIGSSGINQSDLKQSFEQNLQFVTTTDVDQITTIIHQLQPRLAIVDSIQTLSTQDLTGASGSIGQVRESTDRLINVAKGISIPIFLVGHVTKDGVIAGPKVLEHMVDAVLQLEGERTGQFRLLRAHKNRFGATDEVGVFKAVEYGYQEIPNPSELFLENQDKVVPGSAVACIMEGTRPLLIEVQALVNRSKLAMPRRVGRGVELSRIQVLAAVLEKHCGLPLSEHDIFVSAAGGFKLNEPAVDLALAIAIVSSLLEKSVENKIVFAGEIGLLGEIRRVTALERRIKEAERLGHKKVVSAKAHTQLREALKELGLL